MKRGFISVLCIVLFSLLLSCGKVAPAADGKPAKGMTLILGAGEENLPVSEDSITETESNTSGPETEVVTENPDTPTPSITEEVHPSITETLTDRPVTQGGETSTPTPTKAPEVTATPTPTNKPDPTATPTPTRSASGSYSASDCAITLNGVTVKPAGDFTGKQDSVGKVIDVQEGVACLDDGYDINYIYDGFSVLTLSNNGAQKVYSVDVTKTGVTTSKGIKIGTSTDADLVSIYGKPTNSSGMRREYTDGKYTMTFYIESGVVVEILLSDNSAG